MKNAKAKNALPDLCDFARVAVLDFRAVMRRERGDHMTHPSEQSATADPQSRRDDQPEDRAEKLAVVNLAESGNDCAKDGGNSGIFVSHAHTKIALQTYASSAQRA